MSESYKGTFDKEAVYRDSFKKREKGEERKFELEQEIRFKARSRRNRMLGEWLAGRFGLTSAETDAYVKEVILADLEEPGTDDVVAKVMKDIEERGAAIPADDVRAEMERLFAAAYREVEDEFEAGS